MRSNRRATSLSFNTLPSFKPRIIAHNILKNPICMKLIFIIKQTSSINYIICRT